MKFEFFESEFCAVVTIIPETVEETSMLLRISNNAKAGTAQITYHFTAESNPDCRIFIKKIDQKVQRNAISKKSL